MDQIQHASVMTGLKLLSFRMQWFWQRHVVARIPRLVWPNDEIEARVTITTHQLHSPADWENLIAAENALRRLGLSFDTGAGAAGRDWEWDWSLKGPVSVRFRKRRKKPVPMGTFERSARVDWEHDYLRGSAP